MKELVKMCIREHKILVFINISEDYRVLVIRILLLLSPVFTAVSTLQPDVVVENLTLLLRIQEIPVQILANLT
jgi:hypothetical protein